MRIKLALVFLGAGSLLSGTPSPGISLPDFPGGSPSRDVVLFAFDSWAFPFQCRVQTHLVSGEFNSVVLRNGPPGSHDEQVMYYGTVLRIGKRFRMWYIGNYGAEDPDIGYGQGKHVGRVVCYAESADGIHWTKPDLGLVEYNGSKRNNIVDFPDRIARPAAAVLYDPEELDGLRRYKMAYETHRSRGKISEPSLCVAFSPDGLHWRQSPLNPVGPFYEMAGVAKFHHRYYVSGQDLGAAHRPFPQRKLVTFASTDFEHWSPCAAIGLDRSPDQTGPSKEGENSPGLVYDAIDEEAHLGAALWNRGNVLIGVYGQWHRNPAGDRRLLTMDLGLTLSHDAIHHEEPIPGFKLIPAREQPESSAAELFPALIQGQGMENVGDKTYYWYGLWRALGQAGVRLVTWDRDRLGMLQPFTAPNAHAALGEYDPQAITCAFVVTPGAKARVRVNATGLGPYANLRVNLLDDSFRPIPACSGSNGALIAQDGFEAPVSWGLTDTIAGRPAELHLQVKFEGIRYEDARLHAIYLTTAD